MKSRLRQKGSYTVETALLMPFILGVIIMLVYLMIIMYDKSVCEAAVDRGVRYVYFESDSISNKELGNRIRQAVDDRLNERLLCAKDVVVNYDITANFVEIKVEVSTNIALPFFSELTGEFSKVTAKKKVARIKGAKIIRATRRYMMVADYVKEKAGEIKEQGDLEGEVNNGG